jgi:SAM-dependent methyltransferase
MSNTEGLAPAPTSFFMTVGDIAFWIRSAKADARLGHIRSGHAPSSAFDQLYAHTLDPFGAELPQFRYQQRKYASLLSMLPRRRYARVLDVGCGLGAFVRKLAPFADYVLGTDISGEAIAQARKLSLAYPNVEYAQRDMIDLSREEAAFDLVVIADTLYYIDTRTTLVLKSMAAALSSRLASGGLLLIVNHYFFGFDRASRDTREIHDAFRSTPALDCVAEHRRAFFLATLLRRGPL